MVINQKPFSVSLMVFRKQTGCKNSLKTAYLPNESKSDVHWKYACSTSLQSSGNSYTLIVINQRTFSVSLIVHRNNQGAETAKTTISAYCSESKINEKYANIPSQ